MKRSNTAGSEMQLQKKSRKHEKKKRKHGKLKGGKFVDLVIPVNNGLSKTLPETEQVDYTIALTPSKSECENSDYLITEIENDDILSASIEASFNASSEENDSYCYNSISEEFINETIDEDNSTIVSLPIVGSEENQATLSEPEEEEQKLNVQIDNSEEEISCDDTVTDTFNETVQSYATQDGIILILERNQTVYFHGLMLLSILHGEIEVLGHTINKNSQDVKLYSPRGSSLLCLKNITKSDISIANYLINLNIPKDVKLSEDCAVIICRKLDEPNITFIEKHISQQILPRIDTPNLPRVVFQPKGNWNLLRQHQKWDSIIDGINESTKLMICGGKGVGKTTLLRYAINRLLMKFSEVRVVDLDPGQSEFTIPGCISVVKVTEPIFGVNYTHLKSVERSILSNINIAYEPEKYIANVACLLNGYLDPVPTLINYMGFTHGAGINILSAVIIQVKPTDVLQIYSHNTKKNYNSKLDRDIVVENAQLFVHAPLKDFSYNLHQVESMCDNNDGWTAEPRQLREMSILSYVSKILDSASMFSTKAPMYKIALADIIISDLTGQVIDPAAINASLVALCSLEERSASIFECFGWGIVRGIDLNLNVLVLLTLQNQQELEKVTHVVLPGVTLPPSVYMTPDAVTGQMPYVIEGILMDFGQIPKRSRISVKK